MLRQAFSFFLCVVLLSCGGDEALETSLNVNLDQPGILSLVNNHRAAGAYCNGAAKAAVPALIWDDQLAQAALDHSNDMRQNNYFSHQGQDGSRFSERIERAGFEGAAVGENIATGYTTEEAVIAGWMGSEGHCKNIMNGSATHVGIARSNEGALWTMVLGRKSD